MELLIQAFLLNHVDKFRKYTGLHVTVYIKTQDQDQNILRQVENCGKKVT